MNFQTTNPSTNQVIQDWETQPKEEVLQVAKDVHSAFQSWKELPIEKRLPYFTKLGEVLRENKQRYAQMMTDEMGKVITESLAEVEKCALLCDTLVNHAQDWLKPEHVEADGKEHTIVYDPLGVIYIVMPWNYPLWQPFKVALLPLVAGNTIILKHAKNVTGCAMLVQEAIEHAGFPKNVFRTVIIDHDTSDALIESEYVAACSLTGSVASGGKVAAKAAQNIKKTVLELGGSDPFIVCSDADIDKAAKGAVKGRFGNAGQVCIGAKRILVHKDIAQQFTEKFVEYTKQLTIGNPSETTTQIGPLVDEKAAQEMISFIEQATSKGAKIETGGKRWGDKGAFVEPTILSHITLDMDVVCKETFGPVAPIIIVDSEDHAIDIANSSEFGLNGSVWTQDLDKGKRIASKLDIGGAFVNHISASHPMLPLGGIKKSGYGRELGPIAIKEFVNIKAINVYE